MQRIAKFILPNMEIHVYTNNIIKSLQIPSQIHFPDIMHYLENNTVNWTKLLSLLIKAYAKTELMSEEM